MWGVAAIFGVRKPGSAASERLWSKLRFRARLAELAVQFGVKDLRPQKLRAFQPIHLIKETL